MISDLIANRPDPFHRLNIEPVDKLVGFSWPKLAIEPIKSSQNSIVRESAGPTGSIIFKFGRFLFTKSRPLLGILYSLSIPLQKLGS